MIRDKAWNINTAGNIDLLNSFQGGASVAPKQCVWMACADPGDIIMLCNDVSSLSISIISDIDIFLCRTTMKLLLLILIWPVMHTTLRNIVDSFGVVDKSSTQIVITSSSREPAEYVRL